MMYNTVRAAYRTVQNRLRLEIARVPQLLFAYTEQG